MPWKHRHAIGEGVKPALRLNPLAKQSRCLYSVDSESNLLGVYMPSPNERTNRVQIRLSDSMFHRLKTLSDDMGIPYSTLATVAVSEYVTKKEREGYVASEALSGSLNNQREFFDSITKLFAQNTEESKLQQLEE